MKKRIPDIIIHVTNSSAAVFLASSGECSVFPRAGRASVATTVVSALSNIRIRKGASVLVLSTDFFTQFVRLPASQIRGLSKDELFSVLAFEVEPFSSISHDDGFMNFTEGSPDGEFITWNVVQVQRNEFAEILSAVKSVGASLFGLGYVAAEPDVESQKLLITKLFEEISDGKSSLAIIEGKTSGLMASVLTKPWLPVGLMLAASLICLVHFIVLSAISRPVSAECVKLEAMSAAVGSLASRVSSIDSRIRAVEAEQMRRTVDAANLRMCHTAWLVLLRALPSACGDVVVVREITSDGQFGARIDASSAAEDGSYLCMSRLAKLLKGSGWTVLPEHAAIAGSLGGTGPAQFSFRVKFDLSNVAHAEVGAP